MSDLKEVMAARILNSVISLDLEEVCRSYLGGGRQGVPCGLGIEFSAMGGDYELRVKREIDRRGREIRRGG